MRECVSAWVRGCVGAWVRECVSVCPRVYGVVTIPRLTSPTTLTATPVMNSRKTTNGTRDLSRRGISLPTLVFVLTHDSVCVLESKSTYVVAIS